jgi:uncharacterized protein
MREYLVRTSHKPRPLPAGRWAMTQRWNDLLFAHWPIPASRIGALLPDWLEADTFQGSAWLGAVPFWLDRIKVRGVPAIPGLRNFPDLNLRTYVRDRYTGTPGIFFFSVDSNNLLAIAAAHFIYHLPYFLAEMHLEQRSEREFAFYSRRRFASDRVIFKARYRGLGPSRRLVEIRSGSFEHFMSERPCVFSTNRAGQPIRANLHHVPWPLEEAEAEIERNDLPAALGIKLPAAPPILHYSRRMALYIWQLERLHPSRGAQRIPAAAIPST